MAAGKELNGGVDVKEAGGVDQWSCVSLDLCVVPLSLQKSIHLAQQTHTSSRQDHTIIQKAKLLNQKQEYLRHVSVPVDLGICK